MTRQLRRPEPITDRHDVNGFRLRRRDAERVVSRRALDNEQRGATRTFVATRGRRVVGYYSLAVSASDRREATGRVRRNMPEPIPAMLLARLAVDRGAQRERLGRHLLRDAMLRTLDAAEFAGSCGFTRSTSWLRGNGPNPALTCEDAPRQGLEAARTLVSQPDGPGARRGSAPR